jgi:serine protease AprX
LEGPVDDPRIVPSCRDEGDPVVTPRSGTSMKRIALGLAGSIVITCAASMTQASAAADPPLGYDAQSDMGGLSAISRMTGAQSMWANGFTGAGVDVAVIDTGVARVEGLDEPGKVIDGPDLSFDSQDPYLAHTDAFGHGTHMAGIIAGSDVPMSAPPRKCSTCLVKSPYSDTTKFVGIAPDARIINVKVGAFDGAVDVSQVIAAIDWVVQHKNDASVSPPLNIKVLSLSFGTDSVQAAAIDPLVHAAEVAWKAGILVVAAGGNDGRNAGPLGNPAISPAILAVGSSDPVGTLSLVDDRIPKFAEHGTVQRPVDVVAPGVSVISLAVPGSYVDQGVTTGKVGTRFQRGTGTSQSTAVVSGLAALLYSKYPTATPDQIKALLKSIAVPVKIAAAKSYAGSGSVTLATVTRSTPLPTAPAPVYGTGTGSLEAARGSYHVTSNGIALAGEQDIFGRPWVPSNMAPLTEARSTWAGGIWNGTQWAADHFSLVDPATFSWTSVKWSGARWSSAKWTSVKWSGSDWAGARWSDLTWDGARWSGARWSDMTWDGARWSGARWSGARWSAGAWEGARWSGARWSDNGWS